MCVAEDGRTPRRVAIAVGEQLWLVRRQSAGVDWMQVVLARVETTERLDVFNAHLAHRRHDLPTPAAPCVTSQTALAHRRIAGGDMDDERQGCMSGASR